MKNFKSWQDSGNVKLAPLTGFFGTNSSGKSSLLQMLLLFKQTVEHSDNEGVIFFGHNSSLVNLGNFHEVIYGHQPDNKLHLGVSCKLSHSFPTLLTTPPQVIYFAFDTIIQEDEGNPILEGFQYRSLSDDTKITWEDNKLSIGNQTIPIGIQKCYGLPLLENANVPKNLKAFSSMFEELFSHVYYLGPTRVDPRRRYNWQGRHPEHIRQWGDQTIEALLSARVRKLKTLHEEEDIPIEKRVSYWLQEMELAHSFTLDWKTQGSTEYEVRIQKTSSSPPVTLVDMGYGLGQFLPVLVLCYYAPEGSTLILEQPGIHLHPKVQSQLADLLIEVITERNLQILVESHSEHLLNRLQRRVAEEKIAADQTALYFCRNDEGVSTIERLQMDEFGNITNWPENFFGDEMGDLFAMTKAQRERQQKAEG